MKFEVRVGAAVRTVEVESGTAGELRLRIDGRTQIADVSEVAPDTYSILLEGQSFEAQVRHTGDDLLVLCGGEELPVRVRDPRSWRGTQSALPVAAGRQQITAPMPGKVVRVLIAAGQTVEAGQGLMVVEAMKMQNEIRTSKAGTIERVFVKENDTVSAGQPLAIVV